MLGKFFDDARDKSGHSDVVPLCCPSTSPAVRALHEYADRLRDDHNPSWLPVSGPGWRWDQLSFHSAARAGYTMLGGLWMRTVHPYSLWPWPLAKLSNPSTPLAQKAAVRRAFLRASPCCGDDVVQKLRGTVDTEAALLAEEDFLRSLFYMTPGQNIRSECRFGRMKNHSRSAGHNYPDASAAFAEHVLSESWCMLAAAAERCPQYTAHYKCPRTSGMCQTQDIRVCLIFSRCL